MECTRIKTKYKAFLGVQNRAEVSGFSDTQSKPKRIWIACSVLQASAFLPFLPSCTFTVSCSWRREAQRPHRSTLDRSITLLTRAKKRLEYLVTECLPNNYLITALGNRHAKDRYTHPSHLRI